MITGVPIAYSESCTTLLTKVSLSDDRLTPVLSLHKGFFEPAPGAEKQRALGGAVPDTLLR